MAAAELRLTLPVNPARDAVAAVLTEHGFDVSSSSDALAVSRYAQDGGEFDPERFDVRLSEVPEGTLAVFGSATGGGEAGEAARLVGARLAQQGLLAIAAPTESSLPTIPTAPTASGAAAPAGYPGAEVPPGYATATADPSVAPRADHTNVLSIIALVLGFVVPVAGIVTGAIAVSQIKRSGGKGRGLAIGGIAAGGVLTLFLTTVLIGSLAFGLFVATAGPADPYALPEEGGVSVAPDEQAPFDPSALVVGACLDDLAGGFVTSANITDCAQPHSYEAFGGFDVPGTEYPGDETIETAAVDGCEAAYTGYVGVSYQDSRLDYYFVGPTEQTWQVGDREIFCLLYDPQAEQTTGSLAGSGL